VGVHAHVSCLKVTRTFVSLPRALVWARSGWLGLDSSHVCCCRCAAAPCFPSYDPKGFTKKRPAGFTQVRRDVSGQGGIIRGAAAALSQPCAAAPRVRTAQAS
jgi:hypothetical protein